MIPGMAILLDNGFIMGGDSIENLEDEIISSTFFGRIFSLPGVGAGRRSTAAAESDQPRPPPAPRSKG